ncbi:hypothetical protein PFLUV_G00093250 [Perca fluviatilis]|uniref:FAD-binding FR-type domain-containing protein n=1 Tax=Perca fluviatilis TaxID=8168 RepID=A0A6A5FA45_PERFL|nr:hypothetical protein PFLUV_G00093250 [Perca fluviatilis]
MGGLHIVEVNLLPSKVTHLVIKRPEFFHFKPGDYVYINIPEIAKYEWHPFTISSPPEQSDSLWLHIRSMGQWTNRLYEYFRQPQREVVSPKRLAASLRDRRQLTRAQEELFSFTNCNGAVASNENAAVELMMYRQNGSPAPPTSEAPPPDGLGPAERGEAPPTRERFLPSLVRITDSATSSVT